MIKLLHDHMQCTSMVALSFGYIGVYSTLPEYCNLLRPLLKTFFIGSLWLYYNKKKRIPKEMAEYILYYHSY